MKYLKYLVFVLFFIGCSSNDSYDEDDQQTTSSSSDNESADDESETQPYPDGTWCADVEYYNPNTGTRNNYTLNVEVENGELTEIEWRV